MRVSLAIKFGNTVCWPHDSCEKFDKPHCNSIFLMLSFSAINDGLG